MIDHWGDRRWSVTVNKLDWERRELYVYHFDGAKGEDAVTASTVGPGVPARILALLKHILLPLTAWLFISHPSARRFPFPSLHFTNTHMLLDISYLLSLWFCISQSFSLFCLFHHLIFNTYPCLLHSFLSKTLKQSSTHRDILRIHMHSV